MTQLAALNIKISGDSTDLQSDIAQAKQSLAAFEAKAGSASKGAKGFSGSMSKLGNVSGQTRAQIQNTSFQLQDIAVQLQGGTKASTVFAQQIPQLLGGFGALGAVLGVVAGVGIPAVALALTSLSDDVEESDEAVDNFVASLNNATKAFNLARTPVSDLRDEFGQFADEVRDASAIAAQAALSIGLEGLAGAVKKIEAPLADVQQKLAAYMQAVENANTVQAALGERTLSNAAAFDEQDEKVSNAISALSDAAAQIGMTSAEATKLNIELNKLSEAEGMEAVASQSAVVLGLFRDIFPATEKIPLEVANIVTELEAVLRAASAGANASAELKTELQGGRDAARELADEMAFIASLSPEVQARMVVSGVEGGEIPPQALGDLPQTEADKEMQRILERRRKLARTPQKDGPESLDGSTPEDDPFALELERLENFLMTAEEIELEGYQRQQEVLQQALEQKLLTQEEYQAYMEDAAKRHSDTMANLAVYKYGDTLQQTGAFLGAMAGALQGGNDRMLRIARAFSAAEALINSYRAYAQVIADPSLPWFAKIPAAVSVLSAGLGMVSAIKGVSSGGGGGGAAGGSAAAASAPVAASSSALSAPSFGSSSSGAGGGGDTPQSASVQLTLIGEQGFTRSQIVQIAEALNDSGQDGQRLIDIRGRR